MIEKIMIAGFGGQGIILAGKLLAHAAMTAGKNVTHFASYGAEMRGGTCNCSVVISDKQIASPVISNADTTLVMNQPSKKKFEPLCVENGNILINSSLIDEKVNRKDLKGYYIDATHIAEELGSVRSANMVILGAYLKISNIVPIETLINSLNSVISARNKSLIEINKKAIETGYNSL